MTVSRTIRSTVIAVALLLVATACEQTIANRVNGAREAAGRSVLPRAMYLDEAARANSVDMCDAGAVAPSPNALADYDGEIAVAIRELVGSEPLDPAISDPDERNAAATNVLWEQLSGAPTLTDARWDEMGVGETECADGELYMTLLLRDNPTMPATGRYAAPVYGPNRVAHLPALRYGTAINEDGDPEELLLDLWLPPDDVGPRPLVLYVHGGSFQGGEREDFARYAVRYARLGYVVASIDYRLRDNDTPEEQQVAALDAIDDAMESVRWLRSKAATYNIDTTRMLGLGSSAGGAIILGVGHATDPTPGGPLAAFAPTLTAVVSTGAHLTPGLDLIGFDPDDAPTLMFHYDQDTSRYRATWDYAYETCLAIRAADNPCDFVRQPGSGHTIKFDPDEHWWPDEIGPFAWFHLDLANAAG